MSTISETSSRARLAVFRADASPALGAGHLRRCLALAFALEAEGWRTAFAVAGGGAIIVPELSAQGREVRDVGDRYEDLCRLFPDGADLLILDHYRLDRTFEAACRPWSKRIVVIDDLADRAHDCELLLDQTPGRTADAYKSKTQADCRLLLGADYALLRPGFARRRLAAPTGPAARPTNSKMRVFVSLGATDSMNLTPTVLAGIATCGVDVETELLLAGAAPHRAEVAALVEEIGPSCQAHFDHPAPEELMARADLAVGAPGTTAWERACLGLPSLLIQTAKNQTDNRTALVAAGASVFLGLADAIEAADVARAVAGLAADPDTLARMSVAAGRICDGLGARRAAAEIDPPLAADGQAVRLRPARESDGTAMLEWQRHPETRRYARTPEPPGREEHFAWLAKRLSDPGCLLNIVLHGDVLAGVLRLDRRVPNRTQQPEFEVSVFAAPDHKRHGVARAALELGRRLLPEAIFHAEVAPDNAASRALFAAAGYRTSGGNWHISDPRDNVIAATA